ncbi:hypothetical protein [Polaribacter glomeratus]|uniref:Uncharacterized protein n=1 Tax=Polaribacter glomeratus TaxID=102 RepID=A0A2S7WIW6_9FLAO|nr:hypothetical protein [Polaribacter glomeratus]PQJ77548.1 hypothetical protein BTO16_17185 [Polaribacter glomeratus]TXD66142.1 hypothetical protein ESX12_08270 [Polaribacter glomeratus]
MTVKKATTTLFLLIAFVNVTYSQNKQIAIPKIEAPEAQLISVFQKEKMDNPIFLNGNVKEVHKKHISHINPKRLKKITENYQYTLNKNNEVITYTSGVEFDEMNVDYLNSERKQIIKNDTIINHANICYTFKKGKLVSKTIKTLEKTNFIGFTDSIHYNYKNNKLIEIITYQKEVLVEMDEDEVNESYLVSNDYFMTSFSEAKYNENNRIESKLTIEYDQNAMVLFVDKTRYNTSGKNLLIVFRKTSNSYEIVLNDLSDYLINIKENNLNEIPFETNEYDGIFTYDEEDKVIEFETFNVHKEKQQYKIEYKKNTSIVKRATNNNLDIEYHFRYDKNNNPIQEKRFIYIDGRKYLDTEITMEINYFK